MTINYFVNWLKSLAVKKKSEEEIKQVIMMKILNKNAKEGRKIAKWWMALHSNNKQ